MLGARQGAVHGEVGLAEEAPHAGFPGPSQASPFNILGGAGEGAAQQLATAAGGSGGGDPAFPYAYLAPGGSSGGSSSLPSSSYSLSLQDQQTLASGQLPGSMSGQQIAYVEVGTAGGLPIMMPQGQYQTPQYQAPGIVQQQQQQQQQQLASNARAEPARRPKRPYKPPQQVAQERKLKDEANGLIRKLEQQLGRARADLERLQCNNKMLQRKAVVLSKHSSFRRCTAGMLDDLQASMTMGEQLQSMDCQRVLDAAEKGLPERQVLDYLRSMTVEAAVQHYNDVVERVRKLLQQLDRGQEPAVARQQLDDIFTLQDGGSTFGYLQVVNPPVYAELMQAQLDATNLVDRNNPQHWRGVLAAMALSEEQESQLILLLQSYLQRSEQIVERKSKVMQELADELCSEVRSLELSSEGGSADIGDLTSEDSNTVGGGTDDGDEFGAFASQRSLSGNAKAQQAKDELDRLVQVEYWLKFDFTGCVRKLLPSQQQALCMVHSWPFYPDQKHLEAALKEKAGPLWEQHARSAH